MLESWVLSVLTAYGIIYSIRYNVLRNTVQYVLRMYGSRDSNHVDVTRSVVVVHPFHYNCSSVAAPPIHTTFKPQTPSFSLPPILQHTFIKSSVLSPLQYFRQQKNLFEKKLF